MIRRNPSSSNRTPTLPQPQNPPAHPRRWSIAWLLSLGVLVNYFDRVNLSVSYNALVAGFGISAVTFGYLSGAYNWTYAMCQLPVGSLLEDELATLIELAGGQKRLGVAEVAIGCTGTDPGETRRLGDGEAGGALFRDQCGSGFNQRLAQVAMVIAASLEAALPRPTHVREFYITEGGRTIKG